MHSAQPYVHDNYLNINRLLVICKRATVPYPAHGNGGSVAALAIFLLAGQQRVQPRQQGLQALVYSVQTRQVRGQGRLLRLNGADCALEGR